MEKHLLLSNEEFEKQFEEGVLNPILFTHEAHLRLAWIHITKYGVSKAIENIRLQIQEFTKVVGEPEKYNETVTVASIKIMLHYLQKAKTFSFEDFIQEFPELKTSFRELVQSHYSFDVFNLKEAKEKYLEPDLLDFE